MPILERRVQILFDPEEYELLQSYAQREGQSVGAVVRESVRTTLTGTVSVRQSALNRLLARGDASAPETVGDWEAVKDSFERDTLQAIS